MLLDIKFGTGSALYPIKNSPFTFVVAAGPTVASGSVFVFSPQLPVQPSNSLLPYGMYLVVVHEVTGVVITRTTFDLNSAPGFNTLVQLISNSSIPAGRIVCLAVVDTVPWVLQSGALATAIETHLGGSNTGPNRFS